jgi:Ca2+-binding RTX toxin-like protein
VIGGEIDTLISIEDVIGSAFDDIILGNDVANLLSGQSGADRLEGRGGDDTLFGDLGNDILNGGLGNDSLTGGGDADTFVIGANSGNDSITDFTDLDTILFDATSGIDSFLDLVLTQVGSDTLVSFGTDQSILLQGVNVSDMDASDFSFEGTGLPQPDVETSLSGVADSLSHGSGFGLSHGTGFGGAIDHAAISLEVAAQAFQAG